MHHEQPGRQPTHPQSLEIVPTGGGLGAEIRALDLRRLSEQAFQFVHRAWIDHQVLLFRGQQLSDDELIAFSRRFGSLDVAPNQETGQRFVEGYPELYVVSNVIENGRAIGSLGSGEAVWHTDMSYQLEPPKASVLYALEVPSHGGETGFVNMYSAYEALPEALRARLMGLRIKHDGTYNSGGYVRQGVVATDDPIAAPEACRSSNLTRCWMRSGPTRRAPNSPGTTTGRSATLSCGTTAASCTVANRSTRRPDGSCIAPKSRPKRDRRRESLTCRGCV
jgi:hypothetical protein